MIRLTVLAILAAAALANYADAQIFRGDRERVRFSFRSRRAPARGCTGPWCYQPITPLFVQPAFVGWQPRPRSIDFQFRNDGFGGTDFRFRSSRGDFCPWCR